MKNFTRNYTFLLLNFIIFTFSSCENDNFNNQIINSNNQIIIKEYSLTEANSISNFRTTNMKITESLSKRRNKSSNINFSIDSTSIKEIKIGKYTSYSMKINRNESSDEYFENMVFEIKADTTNVYFVKYTPTSEIKYMKDHKSITFTGTSTMSKLYGYYTITGWGAYGDNTDPENTGPIPEGTIVNLPSNCRTITKCNYGGQEHNAGPNCSSIYTVVECSNIPSGNNYPNGTEFGNSSFGQGPGYNTNPSLIFNGNPTNYPNIITTPVYSVGNPATATEFINNLGPTLTANFNSLNQQTKDLVMNFITANLTNPEEKVQTYLLLKYIDLAFISQQNPEIQQSLFSFLLQDIHSTGNTDFAKEAILRMKENPNLKIDVLKSSKSPSYIDTSSIDANTPEGAKFNKIYEKLMISPEFKTLFSDLFGGAQTLYNVKFEIDEHVYSSSTPISEVNGNTSSNNFNDNIVIKINKQILDPNATLWKNNLEVAKTILHEFIHAYLSIKAKHPLVGSPIPGTENMTIEQIINALYGPNVQHDFMFTHLVPTMQNILSQMLNGLTTSQNRTNAENRILHPNNYTNPTNTTPWGWNSYFYYLSLNGLEKSTDFMIQFPIYTDNYDILRQYTQYGHFDLDRITP